jgi:hypothetical protein
MKRQTIQPDYNIYLAGGRTFVPPEAPLLPPPKEPVYFFVQFTKAMTDEERDRIQRQHNLRFNRYVPNFAFLERLDFKTWEALTHDSFYRAVERYKPEYKLSPRIGNQKLRIKERHEPDGLLLRALLFAETDEETIDRIINVINSLRATDASTETKQPGALEDLRSSKEALHRGDAAEASSDYKFDADVIKKLDNRKLGGDLQLVFVLPSTESLLKIAEIEEVQWIEEVAEPDIDASAQTNEVVAETRADCSTHPNLVAGTIQSGTPGVTPVWQHGLDGLNQIIGILDDFIPDITHCMFRGDEGTPIGASHRKIVGNRNPSGKKARHATLVAGIAAGDQISLPGSDPNRGLAWASKLSLDDLSYIKNHRETILDALSREASDGATIHSNSWHEDCRDYNETARNVDNFVRLNEENFVCGATANDDPHEELGPPGTAKNALCVSAGGQHPNHLQHADGRSGPTPDGRRKPDICAPGCGINSALIDSKCLCITPGCATSWATPVIAGAATLVRQYYMEGFHHAGVQNLAEPHRPSAALIKATLLNSTVPMEDVTKYPNNKTGWGLVKLDNTLFFAEGPRNLFIADVRNAGGLDTGQSRAHSITVRSSGQPLKITLVWTDPPAELSAGKALVNDLNLVVTSPGGAEIYRGNVNFAGGFSQPQVNPAPDDPNNVEMVIVRDPALGAWTVTVEGKAVHVGRQGFALVVSGSLG